MGRLWDGYEIAALILAGRADLDSICKNEISLSLITNTNGAAGFSPDTLLVRENGQIHRSRALIKSLLNGDADVFNGRF